MKKLLTLIAFLAVSLSGTARDITADVEPPEWFTQARQALDAKNYDLAIQVLSKTPDRSNADWNNLMGYSLRLKSPPQLPLAEQHYKAALVINPLHLGALEYYGELMLMKNDLAGAEALLKRLEAACVSDCEEAHDLKKDIANFKAKK
jgi:Flp pilus assembly protein TadD